MNIIKRLKRNPCEECIYFVKETNVVSIEKMCV
jgi:hypothetical protein